MRGVRALGAGVLLISSVVWTSAGCRPPAASKAPTAGTELYAVAPDGIVEVLFSTLDQKIFAYRWNASGPFQVTVASAATIAPEQCGAGRRFQQWLQVVSVARITKELTTPIDPNGPEWASLRLRDQSTLDPIEVRFRVPATGVEPVVIQSGGKQFALDMDATVLKGVAAGCSVLSQ